MIHDTATIRTARDGLQRGLTYNEIADLLGVTKNVVAGIVHRHAKGDAKSRPARTSSSKLSNRPDIREAVVAGVEAGLHDAEIERRLTCGGKGLVSEIRLALAAEGVSLAQNRYCRPKTPKKAKSIPASIQAPVVPPKPSSFVLRSIVVASSKPRPKPSGSASTWTDLDLVRLRELVRTQPSAEAVAKSLGRPYFTVRHKMVELGICPVYRPQDPHLWAIERLHEDGQPVRRISIRTGIPIPLVERHLERVGKYGGSSSQDVGKGGIG